uniref:cytochrome b n=1 Tax=Parasaissetia nigra TaxID=1069709 RepID=UPI00220E0BE5|nr:cytochrome b [Parasaissetia nigra]UXW93671.1 cytochrome b [Parasaissetia nigra]
MTKMINVKTPSNIYLWWNLGSSISMMMMIQILTGIFLSMNYMSKSNLFNSSTNIYLNMNYGWETRIMHSNMTSMLFIIMFMHIARGMMFKSFMLMKMWMSGMMMLMMMMMESFIGYSLIWNQMSYWAMMVITNFISAIPNIGKKLIKIIWGNFNINIILINRFLTIHFLIPMLIMMMSMIHLLILHEKKSNNPMGLMNKMDLINLNPLFIMKDMILLSIIFMMLTNINLIKPFIFSNSDNFIMMNYFKTPSHIEPEWYFLFFYSILRSINNKLSGLLIMIMSIIMMMMMPKFNVNKFQSFNSTNKTLMTTLMLTMMLMSMLSTKPVEFPFKEMNMTLTINFFFMFFMMKMNNKLWNQL